MRVINCGVVHDAFAFNSERWEVYLSLTELHGHPTGAADHRLMQQAHDTVRIRWGRQRYAAMKNAEGAAKARLNRRLANGGSDGRSYRSAGDPHDGPSINDNGNVMRMPRSVRRKSRSTSS
jgi:hypothetical protein